MAQELDPLLVAKARKVARRVGLAVRKSRARLSLDNQGGLMLIDPNRNWIVAGSHYDWEPEDIIAYCEAK